MNVSYRFALNFLGLWVTLDSLLAFGLALEKEVGRAIINNSICLWLLAD